MATYPELLQTERLVATRLALDDFDAICRLHRDAHVMRTLSVDGQIYADEVTLTGLRQAVEHWDQHRFGLWAFRFQGNGEFVGRAGLKQYEVEGRPELGLAYAVLSPYWRQGLATEMAAASLQAGFEGLGADSIASWTLPVNGASMRVMQKQGFVYERDIEFAGLPHKLFRLKAAAWRSRNQAH